MRLRREASARWQDVPEGMRDLLPAEARRRSAVEAALREEFRRWGYREVVTPTLEFLETFVRGAGPGVQDRLLKVVDSDGALLALRPEMTVPIARLAATRLLHEGPAPLRVSYVAPVFRGQETGRGRLREFTQAGIEVLGDAGPDADAEVIALAVECLRRAGVEEPALQIGDLGFLTDALSAIPEEEQDEVRMRLYRKEFAGIEDAVSDPALARFLRALPELHGPDAVVRAVPLARTERGAAALGRLSGILERLADYGVADRVTIDLSVIRDFTYYTGVVFEAYGPGSGYPLLGGGRYDGLLARFGANCPATGFAIGVERVLGVVGVVDGAPVDFVVAADAPVRAQAIELVREMRGLGKAVIVSAGRSRQDLMEYARAVDAARALWIEGRSVRIVEVPDQRERVADREAFLVELSGRPRVMSWTH